MNWSALPEIIVGFAAVGAVLWILEKILVPSKSYGKPYESKEQKK